MIEEGKPAERVETGEETAALYSALQQLAIHSQENKSFTLYNFLLFNSFLLVAWATLFTQDRTWIDATACTLLCLVGVLAGFAWEPLGRDYADASDLFQAHLVRSEDFLPARWPRSSKLRKEQLDKKAESSWSPFSGTRVRSRDLLVYTPRVLEGLYAALILLSWVKPYWV